MFTLREFYEPHQVAMQILLQQLLLEEWRGGEVTEQRQAASKFQFTHVLQDFDKQLQSSEYLGS